jgi:hypothetical protein
MQVEWAALADYAAVDAAGKLTVVGVFEEIYSPHEPIIWPAMMLLLRFKIKRPEIGLKQKVVVRLSNEDGAMIFQLEGDVTPNLIPGAKARSEATINQILRINGLQFPKFGSYTFDILLNNNAVAAVPLFVIHRPVSG